ncbi:MAG: adenylyltransferase/cytidyltransferase family protein [Patescibacteria group bacterium]|nr:adenylyltransferase/cytidyltransferase family protein [Patescibacteria group bacterium]
MKKEKKVLVFGTFDHLHPGHQYFLKKAKSLGNRLMVVLARDKNVKKIKGQKPSQNEKQRLIKIKNLDFVDQVFLGQDNLNHKYDIIKKIKPDIIALGYDQKNFTQDLPKYINNKTKIIRLKAFEPGKYKSSIIKQRKNGDL